MEVEIIPNHAFMSIIFSNKVQEMNKYFMRTGRPSLIVPHLDYCDEYKPPLIDIVVLSVGTRYAIVVHEEHLYAVLYNRYLKGGAYAICETKDWLCSLISIVKRNDENGVKSVVISWYDKQTKGDVSEEFTLTKYWRQNMLSKGISVTSSYHKRHILLAWFKNNQKGETGNDQNNIDIKTE